MKSESNRSNRMMRKRFLMLVIALICMPLNAGCDIAKVMAAIGQLVQAIMPATTAAGTTPAAPQAGGTTPVTPAVPAPAATRAYRSTNDVLNSIPPR